MNLSDLWLTAFYLLWILNWGLSLIYIFILSIQSFIEEFLRFITGDTWSWSSNATQQTTAGAQGSRRCWGSGVTVHADASCDARCAQEEVSAALVQHLRMKRMQSKKSLFSYNLWSSTRRQSWWFVGFHRTFRHEIIESWRFHKLSRATLKHEKNNLKLTFHLILRQDNGAP